MIEPRSRLSGHRAGAVMIGDALRRRGHCDVSSRFYEADIDDTPSSWTPRQVWPGEYDLVMLRLAPSIGCSSGMVHHAASRAGWRRTRRQRAR